MGNPTLVQRPGSSKSPSWDYAPAFFSQVPDRLNNTTGRWDVHEYDTLGRMTRWDEVQIDPAVLQPGDPSLITRTFDYDGLGRVVRHTMDDDPRVPGLTSDTLLVYDANNQAVYEERTIDRWETITRWAGERIDWGTTGVAQDVTLQLLPMLRAQNGELRWVMADQSGAAFQIWESDGTELQFELGGVYGSRLDDPTADWIHENPTVTTFGDWRLDGLHGSEPDRTRGLVHHGARHTLLDDGRWLQPEPLLALGATGPSVGTNYAAYAAGNPLQNQDRTGFSPGAVTHDDNFFVQLGVAAMDEFNSSANLAAAPNPAGAGVVGIVTSVRVLSTAALNTARAVASRAGTTYLHNTATANGLGLGAAEAAMGAPAGVTVVGAGGFVDDATAAIGGAAKVAATQARDKLGRFLPTSGAALPPGGAAERVALARRGLAKNTTRTPAYSGDAAFRIPDGAYDQEMRQLVEVKDVDSLAFTSQLKDSITHATREGGAGNVELVVDARTKLSAPLQAAIDDPNVPITLSREELR